MPLAMSGGLRRSMAVPDRAFAADAASPKPQALGDLIVTPSCIRVRELLSGGIYRVHIPPLWTPVFPQNMSHHMDTLVNLCLPPADQGFEGKEREGRVKAQAIS